MRCVSQCILHGQATATPARAAVHTWSVAGAVARLAGATAPHQQQTKQQTGGVAREATVTISPRLLSTTLLTRSGTSGVMQGVPGTAALGVCGPAHVQMPAALRCATHGAHGSEQRVRAATRQPSSAADATLGAETRASDGRGVGHGLHTARKRQTGGLAGAGWGLGVINQPLLVRSFC